MNREAESKHVQLFPQLWDVGPIVLLQSIIGPTNFSIKGDLSNDYAGEKDAVEEEEHNNERERDLWKLNPLQRGQNWLIVLFLCFTRMIWIFSLFFVYRQNRHKIAVSIKKSNIKQYLVTYVIMFDHVVL